MPELPEVETVRRGLAARVEGHRLAEVAQRRADLRWPLPPDFAKRLTGRRVERIDRRAKYLLFRLDADETLIVHLGMSGRMYLAAPGTAAPLAAHDHIRFGTDEGWHVTFHDARRFGMMDLWPTDRLGEHRLLKDLGPEPLSNAFNGPSLSDALAGKQTPIKTALLDQKVVAGLGNIYVSEALFYAGISPRRQATSVAGARALRLAPAIKAVLERAIAAGGSSLRDYVQASGELGYFQHQFAVYDREGQPCPKCACKRGVRRLAQSGRSTFYCPKLQT
jgi:formamidopyrimidine-DNA glycosylase